jgi:hypothetical protein
LTSTVYLVGYTPLFLKFEIVAEFGDVSLWWDTEMLFIFAAEIHWIFVASQTATLAATKSAANIKGKSERQWKHGLYFVDVPQDLSA